MNDDEKYNEKLDINKITGEFVWIGMMTPAKNVDFLRDFAKTLKQVSGKSVDVYGHGPKLYKLREQPGINLKGSISNDDVLKTMSKYSSLLLFSDYEGFPYVIIEAMHMGLVVIARDTFPSLHFTLSDNRGIIIPKEMTPSECAMFIDKFLLKKDGSQLNSSAIRSWAAENLSYKLFNDR